MAETYEMYSETATDTREYTAAQFATMFRQLFGTGVVYDADALAVTQHGAGDKSVDVDIGKAWVYGNLAINDATLNLAIDDNTSGNPRIDRIICQNDITGDKEITIIVLKGTPGAVPAAPALTQTADTWEISLAQIAVANGFASILTTNITDERTYSTAPRLDPARLVMDADLSMASQQVTDAGAASSGSDALTKGDVDTYSSVFYNLPSGAVVPFGVTTPPGGFLPCDGAAVSRTTYAALFAVIGTGYGVGDGSTTFNVPDLESRIIMGHSGSGDYAYLGDTGGEETHELTSAELPAHTHAITFASSTPGGGTFDGVATAAASPGSGTSGSSGVSSAHQNMPPYIRLYWGIKI